MADLPVIQLPLPEEEQPKTLEGYISYNPVKRPLARNIGRALLPKRLENWFLGSQEDEDFLNKYSDNDIPTFEEINANYKSGLYNKDDLINYSNLRNQYEQARANRDYTDVRNANIGQGVVDIGSAAIGGGGATATKAGVSLLRPLLGKKIALQTTQGLLGGGLGGAAHGFGTGLVQEDVNPFTQSLIEGGIGAVTGGGIGYGLGKAGQKIAYNNLFKNDGIGLGRILNDDETKFANYFDDYVSGLKGDPEFITDFSQLPAVGETTPFQKARTDLKLARQGVRPQEVTTGEGLFDQDSWHGTPFEGNINKFDLDFMGSGEGAQMYGAGIYTAKGRDIANKHYRFINPDAEPIKYKGEPLMSLYDKLERQAARLHPREAQSIYDKMSLLETLDYHGGVDDLNYFSPETQNWYKNEIEPNLTMPGRLYRVQVPDNDVLLHSELPLNEQPEKVQKALRDMFFDQGIDIDNPKNIYDMGALNQKPYSEVSGQTLYNIMNGLIDGNTTNRKATSKLFDEYGIKGIRAFGDRDGEIFVTFNPENAKIVESYYPNKLYNNLTDTQKPLKN